MAEENKPLPIAEIVTGVIICIILIVFALPRFMNSGQEDIIGDEASNLYYELVRAKNTAGKNKHRVWIEFQGSSGYTIFEDSNGNGTADAGEPTRTIKLNPVIQFGINPEPPLQNVWGTGTVSRPIEFTNKKDKIYFEPSGQASSTGAVYLITKTDIGQGNDNIRAVKIIGAVGEVSIIKVSLGDSPPWK
jgi:Tfp pilus assembly protein FimT